MLIWTGWGILVVPIAGILAAVGSILGAQTFGSEPIGAAVGLVAGGVAIWFLGQRLNKPEDGFHPKTGEPVVYKNRHGLFWIPMQYYAFVAGVVAIIVLIAGFTSGG